MINNVSVWLLINYDNVVTDKEYISVITDKLCQHGYW